MTLASPVLDALDFTPGPPVCDAPDCEMRADYEVHATCPCIKLMCDEHARWTANADFQAHRRSCYLVCETCGAHGVRITWMERVK
ncbi:MAG: hypothetical protein BGN98_13730 [Microbacterium sp. 69-7]|nr:MAG: hypothetical protein BGN98_13730 [Microbacterium sp. 69-7]